MTHCLWEAYVEHLKYFQEPFSYGQHPDWETYYAFKRVGQSNINAPTWGGIAPWLIWAMITSRLYRVDLGMTVQHDIWTPEHYLADATPTQAKIINFSDFGTQGITLAPAIYCDLDTQHAMFAEEIPDGNIVLAIQLSRK